MERPTAIGVLALQGGVEEHLAALARLDGVAVRRVKRPEDLAGLDGVILPGGESSAVGSLMRQSGLLEALRARIAAGLPAWGTCMGAILLARELENDERRHLALMDLRVRRNAYGGQLDSFIEAVPVACLGGEPFPMVFIRAPSFAELGGGVETLASLRGMPVACRQGAMLATAFHPELTDDPRFHACFVRLVREAAARVRTGADAA